MNISRFLTFAAAGLSPLVALDSAPALTLLATATSHTATTLTDVAYHNLPLTDSGVLGITFKTTKPNQTVIFLLTLQCQTTPTPGSATESPFVLLVDNVGIEPIGPSIGCATSTGAVPLAQSAAQNAIAAVPNAGTHTFSVVVANVGLSTVYFKSSVIIMR